MKKKLILDTNIILRFPKILTLVKGEYQIIIPTDVIKELSVKFIHNNQQLNKSLLELINKAVDQNTVIVTDIPNNIEELKKIKNNFHLSGVDANILLYAEMQKHAGCEVAIATLDKYIINAAKENNIATFSLSDVVDLFEDKSTPKNDSVLEEAYQFSNSQVKNLIISFILGVAITLTGVFGYNHIEEIITTINVWGTIVLSIFLAIGLFIFREKKKLAYGITEFSAGIATIIILFAPKFDYSSIDFNLNFGLKIFGALYIMVRGQDNIIKSLNGTKLGLWLKEKTDIG